MKIHFKPDYFLSSVSHQKLNFSVLCRKDTKASIWKFKLALTFSQRKLPIGSVLDLQMVINSPLNDCGRHKIQSTKPVQVGLFSYIQRVLAQDSVECLFVASLNVELLPSVFKDCWDNLGDILVPFYVFRSVTIDLILNERQVLSLK